MPLDRGLTIVPLCTSPCEMAIQQQTCARRHCCRRSALDADPAAEIATNLKLGRIGDGMAVDIWNPGDDLPVDGLILRWRHRAEKKRPKWVRLRLHPPIPWDGVLKSKAKCDFTFVMQEGTYMLVGNIYGDTRPVNTYQESTYPVYDGTEAHLGDWSVSDIVRDICGGPSARPEIWLMAGSPVGCIAVIGTKELMPYLEWMADGCKD